MRLPVNIAFLLTTTASLPGLAAEVVPVPDFQKEVRPVLEKHCFKCHGPDEQNGGMRFDRKETVMTGGDSGEAAVKPGDAAGSPLIRRITSNHKDDRMPPKGERLGASEADILKRWIAAGAAWPETEAPAIAGKTQTSSHWSFRPLSHPAPPAVKDAAWGLNPVDRFIQARREAAGLLPVPDAPPAVFLRRASYDLTGLPPTAREVEDFEKKAASPASYAAVVNRLLDSQRYGERWGRHWMDWVRYADTAGDNSDYPIPQAYLYRNYIIQCFNNDVPYDRFLTEQIAGDLLPSASQEEKNRLVIATGYLAMARRFGSLLERYPQHLTIEDTLDNLGRTTMGLTLSCARCHDHKFDPVSTRDYYGLYGIFASTRYPMPGLELFQAQRDFVPLLPEAETREILKPFQTETDKLTQKLETMLADCETRSLENARLEKEIPLDEQRKRKSELDRMLRKARDAAEDLAAHLKKMPDMPAAYAVREGRPVNARIQLRGEPERPGAEVPRKFPAILGGHLLPADAQKGSGRLELARWITRPENPLTARVMVNRIWQRHFGKGLVSTTSDFGLRGEAPSHPELLDWLAQEFIRSGWSFKHMHRLIMTSRTYRLSSQDEEANVAGDPGNALYWKFARQRLDAESLRDTLLQISGALDPAPQTAPFPFPPVKDWKYTQHHPFKDDYPSRKRSVYMMVKRLTARPYFQTFDGADANVCTSARDSSVTALQALYFVNDTFVHEQADLYAAALLRDETTDAARLRRAFLSILAREPTQDERQLLTAHLQAVRQRSSNDREAWASLNRSLFRLNEFLYLD